MKKNAVVILLIVLLALCILISGAVFVIFLDIRKEATPEVNNTQLSEEVYQFSLQNSIITNIKDSKKYVKCKLVIELNNYKESQLLNKNSFKVEHMIIEVLRGIPLQEYSKDSIQQKLENNIKKIIESELGITTVNKVYFNEFVTQ